MFDISKVREKECSFRYDGDFIDRYGKAYVPMWVIDALNSGIVCYQGNGNLFIKKQDGCYPVFIGDYVLKDKNGELHIYRQVI